MGFHTEKTSFRLSDAVTDIDIATMDQEDIKQLYRDDKITKETVMTILDIDNISSFIQKMEDADCLKEFIKKRPVSQV